MTGSGSADVVVVGNGVLGLSVAVEIARRDPEVRVTVAGPPERPMAATVAAGAMLNCFAEVTRYTTTHPAYQARFAVARRALDLWPQWLEALAEDAGPEAGTVARASYSDGTFVVLSSKSGPIGAENFQAVHAAAVAHDEPHEFVAAEEVDGLRPALDSRPSQILHLPREGSVDARAVLRALEAAARGLGVEIVPDAVRALLTGEQAVTGVCLADGSVLAADTVVLAAGAASGALAADVLPPGAVPPVLHGTGASLRVRRTPSTGPGARHVLRTPNRAATCGLHVVPLNPLGEQYVGASNLLTCDPVSGPEFGSLHALMRQVCEQLDQGIRFSRIQQWMVGARPVPLDCFPLIGTCSLRGLVFATGTYRDGFHCSPVIARHLAAVVLGDGEKSGDFAWFTPERAPIQTMPAQQAVAETADHAADSMYEQGHSVSFYGGIPLRDFVRSRTQALYDSLTVPVALAPEIVIPQFLVPQAADNDQAALQLKTYLRAAHAHHGPWTDPAADTRPPREVTAVAPRTA
ncbi:NAD(P)/FAD-dependent oxidoreductase [Streptomyces poonensis]|uniref:FAD dependent oxidoreductase domain-containing protein n=1 Tax=Streptomyces poonensis TaxID=68255 RepID=A0A918PCA8_9ACTN|nr:FAD-dependent oxidoreductase [Streptomyces poonensis]GGY97942.1 hypothetical protein GCM10010365_15620 [Streptomyces poonensis]